MAEMYMGQLLPFAGNFVIRGTGAANGALVPINQNSALFALLGVAYGGNGTTTFGLPDLRGRSAVGYGTGNGLSTINLGEMSGAQNTTLNLNQMPVHSHPATTSGLAVNTSGLTVNTSGLSASLKVAATSGDSSDPTNNPLGQVANGYVDGGSATVALATSSIALGGSATIDGTASVSGNVMVGPAGASMPVSLLNPYLAINWLVVMEGLFPSRD
jgi:microcystin-dependent protein